MLKNKLLTSLKCKLSQTLWLLALLPLLSGCQLTKIVGDPPDVPACTNLGDHGWCRNSISATSYFVDDGTGHLYTDLNKKQVKAQLYHDPNTNKDLTWAQLVRLSVIVPAYSEAKLKAWTDNVCHQFNCSNGVGSWNEVIGDLNNHMTTPAPTK